MDARRPAPPRAAFPSRRQAGCEGLKRQFYPGYLAELVDYDYVDGLPLEARQFLAAFTEEHYKGFRLKNETQVSTLDHIRAADAARKRVVRGEDVMAFTKHVDRSVQVMADRAGSPDVSDSGMETVSSGRKRHRVSAAGALVAGASGLQMHEFTATNHVEAAAVEALDDFRAQLDLDRARALRAIEPGLHVPTLAELAASAAALAKKEDVPRGRKTQHRRRRRPNTK